MNGFYSITFRGQADWGMGLLALRNGVLTGCDFAGVKYDGSFVDTGQSVYFRLQMTVPPGVALVQGTPPKSAEYVVPIESHVPKSSINNHQPVLLQTPAGPINVIFRFLRALEI